MGITIIVMRGELQPFGLLEARLGKATWQVWTCRQVWEGTSQATKTVQKALLLQGDTE